MKCACCGQQLPEKLSAIQVVAAEYPGLPVAEMIARGWLGDETTIQDPADLRRRLLSFYAGAPHCPLSLDPEIP